MWVQAAGHPAPSASRSVSINILRKEPEEGGPFFPLKPEDSESARD